MAKKQSGKAKLQKLFYFLLEVIAFGLCHGLVYKLLLETESLNYGMFRSPARYNFEIIATFLAFVIMYFIVFPLFRKSYGGWKASDFGIRFTHFRESMAFASVIFFAALTICNTGFILFPHLPEQIMNAYRIESSMDIYIFVFFVSPVLAGIGEEIYFRSYLQGGLSKIDPSWGPIFAALIFACMHSFQGIIPLIAFHIPGALLVAAVYSRTKNLFAVIFTHIAYDMIAFAELYYIVQNPQDHLQITTPILATSIIGLICIRHYIREIIKELTTIIKNFLKGGKTTLLATIIFVGGFYGASQLFLIDYKSGYYYKKLYLILIISLILGMNYTYAKKQRS